MRPWLERIASACWDRVRSHALTRKGEGDADADTGADELLWLRDLALHAYDWASATASASSGSGSGCPGRVVLVTRRSLGVQLRRQRGRVRGRGR
jgi:hypothetical protein